MIRKVENYYAWVGKAQDIYNYLHTRNKYLYGYRLPLFETTQEPLTYNDFIADDLILVTNYFAWTNPSEFTLDFVEQVNKTWNKFYESWY